MALKPADRDYILGLETQVKTLYGRDDALIDDIRAVTEQVDTIALPDKLQLTDFRYHDPTISDERERVVASLTINPPALTVTAGKDSEGAIVNATKREKATQALLQEAGSRVPGMGTFAAAVDAAVGDGGAWTKFLFSRDLWDARYSIDEALFDDEYEDDAAPVKKVRRTKAERYNAATEDAKKDSGSPFVWINVDPRCVYPIWSGTKLLEVLEVQERPELTVFREYRLSRDRDGNIVPESLGQPEYQPSSSVKVKFCEHWDAERCTYLVAGANDVGEATGHEVQSWEHGYGRPPYFNAFGLMHNYWRNRKVGWSIGQAKKSAVQYMSFLRTVHAQVTARDATSVLQRELPPDARPYVGDDGQPTQVDPDGWQLGTILVGQPGEKIHPVEFPQVAPSLREEMALVRADIAGMATPKVPETIGSGDQSGFAIFQQLSEMRVRFDPIAQSIERMLCEVTRFCWHLIRSKVKETVWVYKDGKGGGWLSLAPDDLKDGVSIAWKLDPERPSSKLIESRYHAEQVQAGFESQDQAIEAQGRNPDEVHKGRIKDYIRQTPEYLQLAMQEVAQEAGRGDILAKATQVAQQGMMPGQQPVPGAPGVPPAMGNGIVPEMGALAMTPGGGGAGPANGSVVGGGPGAVAPMGSMQSAIG